MKAFRRAVASAWVEIGIFAVAVAIVVTSLNGFPQAPQPAAPIDVSLPLEPDLGRFAGTTKLFYFDGIFSDGKIRAVPPENAGAPPLPIARGAVLGIAGWALDPKTNVPAKRVVGVVDSSLRFIAAVGSPRADVAKYLKNDDAVASGFALSIPTIDLPLGLHRLRFRIVGTNGDTFYSAPVALAFNVLPQLPIAEPKPRLTFELAGWKPIASVDGELTVPIGTARVVQLVGWAAADVERDVPFTRALFYVDGTVRATTDLPDIRPDIAERLKHPEFDRVGFDVQLSTAGLASGKHIVAVRLEAAGIPGTIGVNPRLTLVR